MQNNDSYYVGIDLGGTNLRCVTIDDKGTILSRAECPTHASDGVEAVIDRIMATISEATTRADVSHRMLSAIGIGVPGPLNQASGVVFSTPNMPGWKNVRLKDIIESATNTRTFIDNDANCAGWGEHVMGAGRNCRHMMMVTLGTGVGGAIIIDGKLHIGRDGAAGELGHVCVVDGGRRCGCGARGCIEAYASATGVVKRFLDYLEQGWPSSLSGMGDQVTCWDIFDAAASDAVALKIVQETGHYLGIMASSVAELLNPEKCVVAGGMAEAGEILFSAIRNTCLQRNQHPSRTMEIVPATLGGNAGLIGAAHLAIIRSTDSH